MNALGALLLASLAASGSAGAETSERRPAAREPALRITSLRPLTVRGHHFRPQERVKLLINAGGPAARAVTASADGAFIVRTGLRVERCSAVVVQAIGNRGSRATIDAPMPECASVGPDVIDR